MPVSGVALPSASSNYVGGNTLPRGSTTPVINVPSSCTMTSSLVPTTWVVYTPPELSINSRAL